MAIYKLLTEDFDDVDYQIIAIHTNLEEHKLAYLINKNLPILLAKHSSDISLTEKGMDVNFSRYTYEDQNRDVVWNLIENKCTIVQENRNLISGLFENTVDEISVQSYLLPEYKKVDYILKIENLLDDNDILNTVTILKEIEQITTAYTIEAENIKSKNNLIF